MQVRILFSIYILVISFMACKSAKMAVDSQESAPIIIEGGQVTGRVEAGLTVYKGIPFAAPPVGNLRWAAPKPVIPWDGVLKADKFAPACPQMKITVPDYKLDETSEDCLYLNVWTPAKSPTDKLPVMVWIYGGGFSIGNTSTPLYNGAELAKQDVLLVSVAYRVGPLGFLAHPELSAESPNKVSGNYGLLDQLAGLKWVQKNISAFGGDPGNVTIFGESAGAISVNILAASPLARGLFQRAISQSGGSMEPACKNGRTEDCLLTLKDSEEKGRSLANRLGGKSVADLRRMDADKLVKDAGGKMGAYWPNLDGYLIPSDLYTLYEKNEYNDVDILVGTNSDEGGVFVTPGDAFNHTEPALKRRFGPFANRILQLYPIGDLVINKWSLANLFGDTRFGWHTWTWARLQAQTSRKNSYVYYFDHVSTFSMINVALGLTGAAHGAELPFVFNKLGKEKLLEDQQLSATMVTYWTNFAKYGDPNGEGLPHWPRFRDGEPTVMYLNTKPKAGPYPGLERLMALDEYYQWLRNQ